VTPSGSGAAPVWITAAGGQVLASCSADDQAVLSSWTAIDGFRLDQVQPGALAERVGQLPARQPDRQHRDRHLHSWRVHRPEIIVHCGQLSACTHPPAGRTGLG
jgi:hypothetical protein